MSSCKNCIHYNVCFKKPIHDVGADLVELGGCSDFKDKQKFVKLPCKVGDEVYYIFKDKIDRKAINCLVISDPLKITEVGTRGFWTSRFPNENSMDDFEPWDSIGKTVFLTREEAYNYISEIKGVN
ncbi:MAG: hypothetical protein J1E85_07010 [Ruminococcus sp.]|nr:hypothetical protein [Ruminococcus sp.]